jgi:hypothetical protein
VKTFIRLSENDGDPNKTDASFSRAIFSPRGTQHEIERRLGAIDGRDDRFGCAPGVTGPVPAECAQLL